MRNGNTRAKSGLGPAARSATPGSGKGPTGGRPAVLCVQQRSGGEIKRLLSALKAPLRLCASGQEAIEAARAGGPLTCAIAPLPE